MRGPLLVVVSMLAAFLRGSYSAAGPGRRSGDVLAVGETVRIHALVEEDYHFHIVGCGANQCGGVRVDGVDRKGMGFRTFLSLADQPFRAHWVVDEDFPFGTSFVPGREFTFFVRRPADQELQVWLEGREERVAEVKLEGEETRLLVGLKHGTYSFLSDDQEDSGSKAFERPQCESTGKPPIEELLRDGTEDIIDVTMGCKYRGDEKQRGMCVVYLAVEGDKHKVELYRSELARDAYDPRRKETVRLPFRFQEAQSLVFAAYREYSDCDTPDEGGLRGTLQTPLATVNSKGKVELSLTESSGEVFSVQFKLNCEEKITLEFSGKHLTMGQGDVYLKIMKSPPSISADKNFGFIEVARTNKVPRDIHFLRWDEMTVPVNTLCDGDYDRPLKVYALEEDGHGDVQLIGHFDTTLNQLKEPKSVFRLRLVGNQVDDSSSDAAEIYAGEIPKSPTFSQYVAVGFELIGTVQIDYTSSNAGPTPSLHHIGEEPNQYEVAIRAVGEIVEKFVADEVFKVYGFGADLPSSWTTSFDFNVNFDETDPDCAGVDGVLKAYHESLEKVSLSGPTHFAPGLRKVVESARRYEDGSKYFVHLLLTDGLLHDAEETKKVILEASGLPISIIIVGIGGADFTELQALVDHAENSTESAVKFWGGGGGGGARAERDIVQFVAMKRFLQDGGDVDAEAGLRSLRKSVLSKIPPQYLEYMKIRKIPPKPPKNSTITRECETPIFG